jgi:hypothetical protein
MSAEKLKQSTAQPVSLSDDEPVHHIADAAPSHVARAWEMFSGKFRELFGIDYRTMAVGRMALAGTVLIDLMMRARDMRAHYTDFGILPRAVHLEKTISVFDFSLHMAAGHSYGLWFLFALNAIVLTCMAIGFQTRVMSALAWLFMVSLQNRNPMILHAGDVEIRCLLFFAMFLPLGKMWSLDARRDSSPATDTNKNYLSVATVAILLQVCIVYVFSTFHKTGPEWRVDRTAAFLALNLDQFATPIGIWARQFREALEILTGFTLWWEFWGPFLFFAPIFNAPIRFAAMTAFIFMHMNFEILLGLGIFPFFSAAGLLLFMPGKTFGWINAVKDRFSANDGASNIPSVASRLLLNSHPTAAAENGASTWGKARHWAGQFAQLIPLVAITIIFVWNIQTLPAGNRYIQQSQEWILRVPRLDQKWDMFSPKPLTEDGWYVMEGQLDAGAPVDVYNQLLQPVSWEKPELVSATYPNERWQKYLMNLWYKKHRYQWLYYGKYVCRSWNEFKTGADRLKSFEIFFMLVHSNPKLESGKEPPQKVSLWRHTCY